MKEEAQLYFTDYNESYYVPHWTMWSLSDGPPHPVGPPPPAPGPPHGDESGREDYCAAKRLAFSYANKLLAAVDASDVQVKLHQVSDALQLETACRNTSDSPRRWDLLEQQEGLRQPSSGSGVPSLVSVYVDAAAGVDDEHSGGAPGAPMRTVSAALGRLRALRAGRTAPAELVLRGSAVHFVGGHPIALTAEDSFLTIRGHAGENPTLSAGVALALSWQPVAGKPGVFSSPVPRNLTGFSTLYVNGRRAVRARTPDANPETQGLHTPNQTGYFAPSSAKANGTLRQKCGPKLPAGLCPVVAGPSWVDGSVFKYGHFQGAADQSVGYSRKHTSNPPLLVIYVPFPVDCL
jgi:hypothetical protein